MATCDMVDIGLTLPGSSINPLLWGGGVEAPSINDDYLWTPTPIDPYIPVVLPEGCIEFTAPTETADITYSGPGELAQIPAINIAPLTLAQPPTLDAAAPDLGGPDSPGPWTGSVDTDFTAGTIAPVEPLVVDSAPTINCPAVAPMPPLTIPTFSAAPPTAAISGTLPSFSFTEGGYSSALLNKSTSEILRMLNGGVGIPESTWVLMLQKGTEREDISNAKLVEEATSDWASKGWSSPGGVLDMRIREARQKGLSANATLSRDMTVRQSEMELDNLKYAMAQALATDQMLVELHNSTMDRALRAAEATVKVAVDLLSAQIAMYNAELKMYEVEASVFKTKIEVALVQVDIYKAQVEAGKICTEQGKLAVEAYAAGVDAAVAAHRGNIEAMKAQVAIEQVKVSAFSASIDAYSAESRAWVGQWQGYASAWAGPTAKADVYRSTVQAYAAAMSGYRTGVDALSLGVEADIKMANVEIERSRAGVGIYSANVSGEVARVNALAQSFGAKMDAYKAQASFASAEASANADRWKVEVSNATAFANSSTENARILEGSLQAQTSFNLQANTAAAKIVAQLEASRLGQFNATEARSSRWSTSINCTR